MIPLHSNETLNSSSANLHNAMGDGSGLAFVLIFVLYAVGALLAFRVVSPKLAQNRILRKTGQGIVLALQLAIKGAAASAVLSLLAVPVYLVATADGGTRKLAIEYIGWALFGVIALIGIGWFADRAVAAYLDAHPDYDEWGDLFPEGKNESDAEIAADGGKSEK